MTKRTEKAESSVLSKREQRKLKKQQEHEKEESEDSSSSGDIEDIEARLDLDRLAQSASEAELSSDDDDDDVFDDATEHLDDDEKVEAETAEDEEEEKDVPLSDVEFDSDADIVPYTKVTINNQAALKESLARIQLPWDTCKFDEHQSITSNEATASQVTDIYDDTERELAFYKQAINAVMEGRSKLLKLKIPFSRPLDYFAEMIKSDEHMDKLKSKLVEEASEKKAREDARKQRQLKKFGKQVQNETLQSRQKEKKETLDKIKSLKRKRKDQELGDDDFAIALEEAAATNEERHDRHKPNGKRLAKNSKYGQGGMKRFKRKNDAESSADLSEYDRRKGGGPGKSNYSKPRPGKSKRRQNNRH
ncbi:BA75_01972T0 [Komagataella pastoris]|uniref:BA75_01972T0 n=1 Tax=Komagataella pastoris TaxID=4922 RepID=A0A1B2JBC7_PICPA|nr:BA75_01972T0 [Komagataella pastoris]